MRDKLDIAEAAAEMGVHPATIRKWIKAGLLGVSDGRYRRTVSVKDLQQVRARLQAQEHQRRMERATEKLRNTLR